MVVGPQPPGRLRVGLESGTWPCGADACGAGLIRGLSGQGTEVQPSRPRRGMLRLAGWGRCERGEASAGRGRAPSTPSAGSPRDPAAPARCCRGPASSLRPALPPPSLPNPSLLLALSLAGKLGWARGVSPGSTVEARGAGAEPAQGCWRELQGWPGAHPLLGARRRRGSLCWVCVLSGHASPSGRGTGREIEMWVFSLWKLCPRPWEWRALGREWRQDAPRAREWEGGREVERVPDGRDSEWEAAGLGEPHRGRRGAQGTSCPLHLRLRERIRFTFGRCRICACSHLT